MTAAAAKHTPGPWDYEFGHPMQSGIRYWQAHNGEDAICSNQFCYAANGDEAASEANARLIAAAPEMYAAAKRSLSQHEAVIALIERHHGGDLTLSEFEHAITGLFTGSRALGDAALTRAAIAKAEAV